MERRQPPPADTSLAYFCRDVCRGYRGALSFQLRNIHLELRPGEITGLVGVNGAGKTTLIRIVAGELLPDSGHYAYPLLQPEGTNPRRLHWGAIRSQIAFVRQRPYRWWGRVIENLYREAAFHGLYGQENIDEVDFLLQRLGLEKYRFARWTQLSGGYAMRFELAKALIGRPRLLILDEPLAPLDIDTQLVFLQDLRDLAASARRPLPILISSQHVYETEMVADKLLFLSNGTPEFYGPTPEIGADRTENAFELSSTASKADIVEALGALSLACEQTALRTFLIRTPLAVSAHDVLNVMVHEEISVTYFRDVSRSTRTLFDSARRASCGA